MSCSSIVGTTLRHTTFSDLDTISHTLLHLVFIGTHVYSTIFWIDCLPHLPGSLLRNHDDSNNPLKANVIGEASVGTAVSCIRRKATVDDNMNHASDLHLQPLTKIVDLVLCQYGPLSHVIEQGQGPKANGIGVAYADDEKRVTQASIVADDIFLILYPLSSFCPMGCPVDRADKSQMMPIGMKG